MRTERMFPKKPWSMSPLQFQQTGQPAFVLHDAVLDAAYESAERDK